MSKQEDILLSKPPSIHFEPNSKLTIEDLKADLLIPFIVKKLKEGEKNE